MTKQRQDEGAELLCCGWRLRRSFNRLWTYQESEELIRLLSGCHHRSLFFSLHPLSWPLLTDPDNAVFSSIFVSRRTLGISGLRHFPCLRIPISSLLAIIVNTIIQEMWYFGGQTQRSSYSMSNLDWVAFICPWPWIFIDYLCTVKAVIGRCIWLKWCPVKLSYLTFLQVLQHHLTSMSSSATLDLLNYPI